MMKVIYFYGNNFLVQKEILLTIKIYLITIFNDIFKKYFKIKKWGSIEKQFLFIYDGHLRMVIQTEIVQERGIK